MQVLVLCAHPQLNKSRINRALVEAIRNLSHVTVHELYRQYPDFLIDIAREQELLKKHDVIVFQHPFYWYSAPALLKEWLDAVLEYGFAYGTEGKHLVGKKLLSAISTGSAVEDYQPGGLHTFSVTELLRPFEQTAALCGMIYETPFVTSNPRDDAELQNAAARYQAHIAKYTQLAER